MSTSWRRGVAGLLAVAVMGALAGVWVMRARRGTEGPGTGLQRAVGTRLAVETAQVVGTQAQLVVVFLERGLSSAADVQRAAFEKELRRWPGIRVVRTDEVGGAPGSKHGPGHGLSARRLRRLLEKHRDADALVSLIGLPDPEDFAEERKDRDSPRLVAISRSPKKLAPWLERGWLERAIVPRFTFPAPGPEQPVTAEEWFQNRFQVVSARDL